MVYGYQNYQGYSPYGNPAVQYIPQNYTNQNFSSPYYYGNQNAANYQNQYSPTSQNQNNSQPVQSEETLSGKIVDSIDVVKAINADLSGKPNYYPKSDGTEIYCKRINLQTGASGIQTYVLQLENPTKKSALEEKVSEQVSEQVGKQVATLLSDFKSEISNEMEKMKTSLVDSVNSVNNTVGNLTSSFSSGGRR